MIEGLLQPTHLLLILLVAFFVFGPKKLPELGKGLAQGIRSFKDGIKLTAPAATSEITEKTDSTNKQLPIASPHAEE
jgi:sec-independent protein translocase protein TatA